MIIGGWVVRAMSAGSRGRPGLPPVVDVLLAVAIVLVGLLPWWVRAWPSPEDVLADGEGYRFALRVWQVSSLWTTAVVLALLLLMGPVLRRSAGAAADVRAAWSAVPALVAVAGIWAEGVLQLVAGAGGLVDQVVLTRWPSAAQESGGVMAGAAVLGRLAPVVALIWAAIVARSAAGPAARRPPTVRHLITGCWVAAATLLVVPAVSLAPRLGAPGEQVIVGYGGEPSEELTAIMTGARDTLTISGQDGFLDLPTPFAAVGALLVLLACGRVLGQLRWDAGPESTTPDQSTNA